MATRSFYQNIINELDSDLLNNNTEIFISPISYQDNTLSLADNNIDNVILNNKTLDDTLLFRGIYEPNSKKSDNNN